MTEEAYTNKVEADQEEEKKKGRYKFKKKKKKNGFDGEVHEYLCPNGEIGYQIFMFKNNQVKSKGYGHEAATRTFNWSDIVVDDIVVRT